MNRTVSLFAGLALLTTSAFAGDGNVRRSARRIPGRYIVVLETGADTATFANAVRGLKGGRVQHTFERGLKGLTVEISDADAQALARDSRAAECAIVTLLFNFALESGPPAVRAGLSMA